MATGSTAAAAAVGRGGGVTSVAAGAAATTTSTAAAASAAAAAAAARRPATAAAQMDKKAGVLTRREKSTKQQEQLHLAIGKSKREQLEDSGIGLDENLPPAPPTMEQCYKVLATPPTGKKRTTPLPSPKSAPAVGLAVDHFPSLTSELPARGATDVTGKSGAAGAVAAAAPAHQQLSTSTGGTRNAGRIQRASSDGGAERGTAAHVTVTSQASRVGRAAQEEATNSTGSGLKCTPVSVGGGARAGQSRSSTSTASSSRSRHRSLDQPEPEQSPEAATTTTATGSDLQSSQLVSRVSAALLQQESSSGPSGEAAGVPVRRESTRTSSSSSSSSVFSRKASSSESQSRTTFQIGSDSEEDAASGSGSGRSSRRSSQKSKESKGKGRFRRMLNPLRRSHSAGCSQDVPAHALFLRHEAEKKRSSSQKSIERSTSGTDAGQFGSDSEGEDAKSAKAKKKSLARDLKDKMAFLRRRHTDTALASKVGDPKRPTPEAVLSWSKSFEHLLYDKVGLEMFRDFLQSEFSDENLEFWIACEEYKSLKSAKMAEQAQKIHSDFVAVQAPREINLDSKTRMACHNAMSNPNKNTFALAQKRIQALMEKDSYPRFLKSETYQELCTELKLNT